jgi:hypothetical protein
MKYRRFCAAGGTSINDLLKLVTGKLALNMKQHQLRLTSWLLAGASIFLPAVLLIHEIRGAPPTVQGHLGGLGEVAVLAAALLLCFVLSIVASVFNGLHLRRDRSAAWIRYCEFSLIASPALAIGLIAAISIVRL